MITKLLRASIMLLAFCLLINGCKFTDPYGGTTNTPYIYHIGEISTTGFSYAVALSVNKAYVADGVGGLRIIDRSNPHFLMELRKYEDDGVYYDIKQRGDYAYLACGDNGLRIIDCESPFGLEVIGEYRTDNAFALEMAGDYVYLADDTGGIRLLDVSIPYSIRELSRLWLSGQNVYSVTMSWPNLYVGSKYGFSIVNVDNPYSPFEEHFEHLDYVYDIDISGDFAYVAYYGGLDIYDVSIIREPKLKGRLILPSPARSVTVQGEYAYLTLGTGGLSIVKITDPSEPYEVTWYRPADCEMNDVVASGKYLYIANGLQGLLVVEFWFGY